MVVAGEAAAPPVHQLGPFPAQRLRQQEAPLPGDVQGGRMELDVLHARQHGPGPESHSEAGPLGARRVGGVRVQVAEPPGGEDGGRGADGLEAVPPVADSGDAAVDAGILMICQRDDKVRSRREQEIDGARPISAKRRQTGGSSTYRRRDSPRQTLALAIMYIREPLLHRLLWDQTVLASTARLQRQALDAAPVGISLPGHHHQPILILLFRSTVVPRQEHERPRTGPPRAPGPPPWCSSSHGC